MTVEIWAAFVAASLVLLIIPGPTILLVVSYALGQGWRAALPMALGVALGDFTAMSAALLGLGAVLASSAALFTLLKWAGAAYLIWLGIKLWRAGGRLEVTARASDTPAWRMAGHAWLVTALNPKSLTFFLAFLPQFLDPGAALVPQLAILAPTFLTLAFANALTYALLASRARRAVGRLGVLRLINRVGGGLLIGAGLASVALESRS